MDYHEYAIIGTGPSGISAALQLEKLDACIIDVAQSSKSQFPYPSLSTALDDKNSQGLLGQNWDFLDNIQYPNNIHPKLRSEHVRHVMQGEKFAVFEEKNRLVVKGQGSYAAGGMANIWGGQLLRYFQDDFVDLASWPIDINELNPFYTDLEEHIGLSGENDAMAHYLGENKNLLPPVPIGPAASYLLKKYQTHKSRKSLKGLSLGHPRLAVLTQAYKNRTAYNFGETEFFKIGEDGIYNPKQSLSDIIERGQSKYYAGYKLTQYQEYDDYVDLYLEEVSTKRTRQIRVKHLLLGCGTIQTSKLILQQYAEKGIRLPFLDHPPHLLPVFFPKVFGTSITSKTYPIQLVATQAHDGIRDMISFYYPGGMLWSDIVSDIPLPLKKAFQILPVLINSMLVAQIWEPTSSHQSNYLSLSPDQDIKIQYNYREKSKSIPPLISKLRHLGGISLSRLASSSLPSWGFHHAGTLPMKSSPQKYETHTDGRLWDSQRVRIIDASVLPSLPAKNSSFTMMANAARIAQEATRLK